MNAEGKWYVKTKGLRVTAIGNDWKGRQVSGTTKRRQRGYHV